ncbi:MAG: hypothetical protein R3A10_03870 [Caldilineaceae bacterium]
MTDATATRWRRLRTQSPCWKGDVDAAFFVLAPVSEVLPRLMADEELALKRLPAGQGV